MKLLNYSDKERKIVWWVMLILMLAFLSYSLFTLSKEGAIEYCVGDNSTGLMNVTCYKTRVEAQHYADLISYPKNLDHNYISNYTNIDIWDK